MTPDGTWQNDREAHFPVAEPTVQVPVSLIEGLLDDFGNRRARAVREARALLSQRTPSAEPSGRDLAYAPVINDFGTETRPNRPADLPTAHDALIWYGSPGQYVSTREADACLSGAEFILHALDPSMIRDVRERA